MIVLQLLYTRPARPRGSRFCSAELGKPSISKMRDGRQQAASVLCLTICFLMTAAEQSVTDITSDGRESLMTFRLSRITRESVNNGHNVKLYLTGGEANLPTVYLVKNWHQQPQHLGKPSNGTIEFHAESDDIGVYFLHPGGYQTVMFSLNDHSPAEQLVPDIELSSQEGREITFGQGEDTDVRVLLSMEESNQSAVNEVNMYGGVVVKSTTEDHVVELHTDGSQFPFYVLNQSKADNSIHLHLHVNTSSGDVEGLVELDAFISCTSVDACLFGYYIIHVDLPLYQEGNEGPFPDNYIGIMNSAGVERSNQTVCNTNEPEYCRIRCEFIGNNPSAVEFARISGLLTPSCQVSVFNEGFRALGVLSFENLIAAEEAEYQCKSRSGSEEVSVTTKVVVLH